VEIYNIAGTPVREKDFFGLNQTKYIGDQPDGVCIMRIIHDDHKYETMSYVLQR
jgi:hypothetical protein